LPHPWPKSAASAEEAVYAFRCPERAATTATLPLAIVVCPIGTDAFHVALREPILTAAADRHGWALAVISPLYSTDDVRPHRGAVAAVRRDVLSRFPMDPSRICMIALATPLPAPWLKPVTGPERFAALGLLEGQWDGTGGWRARSVAKAALSENYFYSQSGRGAP